MMKRVWSVLLALALCVSLLPVPARAASGSGTANDPWQIGKDAPNDVTAVLDNGVLTISGTGAMADYSGSSLPPWWADRRTISGVIVEKGVTCIGNCAFDGITDLRSASIPDSVTRIGIAAFRSCNKLTSFPIPDSVTSIGDHAFDGCSKPQSVTISRNVTHIGFEAFVYCHALREILVDAANPNYSSVDGVLFNKDRSVLIFCPFNCILGDYVIPSSVKRIERDAFVSSQGLKSITIPNGVTCIEPYTFNGCSMTSVTIPNSVTSIGDFAFSGCHKLTDLKIPDSVTSIGTCAFQGCDALTSVTVPGSVKNFGERMFEDCDGLTSVTISNGITSVGSMAFGWCRKLQTVTFPNGVTSIGGHFRECTSLASVTIPSSVTSIVNEFHDCYNLKDVYYGGTEAQWKAISISSNNEPLTKATIHYNTTMINGQVVTSGPTSRVPSSKYCIHVVDENGEIVSGAAVTYDSETAETNQNGDAFFARLTAGEPTITVKKAGYKDWSNANSNWKKSEDHFDTVILYSNGCSDYQLAWAAYSASPDMKKPFDVLTKTKKLNLKNDGNWIGDLTYGDFYLSCAAIKQDGVDHYELWQKDKLIALSNNGDFGKLSVKSFSKGGDCFVRVSTSRLMEVDTHINLEFAENTVQKENSISIKDTKISFTVRDEVPFLGGSKVDFSLPLSCPVYCVAKDEKFALGLNFKAPKASPKDEEEQLDEWRRNIEKACLYGYANLSKADRDGLKSAVSKYNQSKWGSINKVDISLCGYLEGDLGSSTASGYILITADWKVYKGEFNTVIGVVPVTVQLDSKLSIEAGGKGTVNIKTWQIDGNIMINPSVKIDAFGGVGVSKIIGVGAYGSAALDAKWNILGTQQGLQSVDLTGELGLKAYLAWAEYKRTFAHQTWHLYTANNVQAAVRSSAIYAAWNAGLYDAAQYRADDLSYLAAESAWLGDPSNVTRRNLYAAADPNEWRAYAVSLQAGPAGNTAKTEFNSLLTDTYRNAQPVMISDGSALYAAFIRADAVTGSRYVVVTKFDGTSWAEPVRVDADAILDDAPTLCVDENGMVWLAYAKTTSAPGDSLLTYAQDQQIVVGSIDPSTLAFTESKTYSGSGFAHMQKLEVLNGQPVLTWADTALTDENSVLQPASGTIYSATCTGGMWSEAQTLTDVTGTISSVTPGLAGGVPAAAYVVGDALYTTANQTTLIAENVVGRVTWGTLPGTSDAAFIWNGNGALHSSLGATIPAQGVTSEYAVVGSRIYYSTPTDSSANLAVLQYENGNWGLPMQLTGDSRYLENLSVVRLNGQDYVLGMHTAVTITETDVDDAKNLVWSAVMPVSDLRLDGVDYDTDGLIAGESVPVTLTVTNAGDHTVNSVSIALDEETVGTENVDLLPGQSAELTTSVTCPATLTEYTLTVNEPGEGDYTPEDNSGKLNIGYADAAVELNYQQIGTSRALVATVTNQGVAAASGSVVFYDANGNAVAESTFEELGAGDVAVAECVLDESFAGIRGGDVSAVATLAQEELYTFNNSDTLHIMDPFTEIRSVTAAGIAVTASVYCESDVTARAFCAAYTGAGQMLGIWSSPLTAGDANTLGFTVPTDAKTVRVFVLDAAHVPLCARWELEL